MVLLLRPAPKGAKTGRKAGRLIVGGSSKTEVKASTLSRVSYTVTIGRYHYKYKSVFSYSRIHMNNVITCVKNQVLPSIVACHDGNYIGNYKLLLNSL